MGRKFIVIFTAGRLYRKMTSFFAFNQFDIFVLDVNDGRFLVFPKKVILFLVFNSAERLDWAVVEIDWAQVCVAFITVFKVLLQKQVVSSCYVIVFVCLNTPLGVFDIKVKLFQFLKNILVDWNPVKAYDDSTI